MLAPLEYGGFQLPLKGEDSMRVGKVNFSCLNFYSIAGGLTRQSAPLSRASHSSNCDAATTRT